MSATEITCEHVDQEDLDTRFLAGRLSPQEAETFEAHFFGCERCWGLVQQGLAIRSALGPDATAPPLAGVASISRKPPSRWWALAAAAALAVVVVGTWWPGQRSRPAPSEDVLRGGEAPLPVIASGSRTALQAAWPRLANADLYQVRLYSAEGTLVAQREVRDTSIELLRDSIPLPPQAPAFWDVQALDHLRQLVARSALTEAKTSDPGP